MLTKKNGTEERPQCRIQQAVEKTIKEPLRRGLHSRRIVTEDGIRNVGSAVAD